MQFSEFEASINEQMLLYDKGLVKLVISIIAAARLPIVPPWVLLVGASSGGKSMILNGLKEIEGVIKIDKITPQTFMSGMKGTGKNNSLLLNLPKDAIFCFSDFTTIISMNREARGEIFGQMRRIWDGDMHNKTGNGQSKSWDGKPPAVIGGVTTKIYSVLPEMADMGERLILYHITMPDRKAVSKFAIRRLNDKSNETKIRELFGRFLKELVIPEAIPTFTEQLEDELIDLADLATRARSSIERDLYDRNKAAQMTHDLEMPIRLLKTIMSVACGMAVVNGTNDLEPYDKHILYRLALDSIPLNRKLVMNHLTAYEEQKAEDIEIALAMDKGVVYRTLQDLNSLGVVTKQKASYGNGFSWKLKYEYRELLSKFEGIIMDAVPTQLATVAEQEEEGPVGWENLLFTTEPV